MFVTECLNNPRMLLMRCTSENMDESTCICHVSQWKKISSAKILLHNDLYNDSIFNNSVNHINENQEKDKSISILDCLDENMNTIWKCTTHRDTISETTCVCEKVDQDTDLKMFETDDLYKNFNLHNKSSQNVVTESQDINSKAYEQNMIKDNVEIKQKPIFNVEDNFLFFEIDYTYILLMVLITLVIYCIKYHCLIKFTYRKNIILLNSGKK